MRNLKIISIVLLIAVLAFLPTVIKKDSIINLLILVFLYIILASSWNILGGYTGQVSLGHAAFFGLGALMTRQLWLRGFPILPSILAGGLVAVVFALLIGGTRLACSIGAEPFNRQAYSPLPLPTFS